MRTNGIGWVTGLVLMIAMPVAMFAGGWGKQVGQKPQQDDYRLEGPFTHGNLSVFLVHGKDKIKSVTFITLQEALVQKKVIVRETRSVNELSIENVSSDEVYVQSGDIVKGGQQDRMLVVDLILPRRTQAKFRLRPFVSRMDAGAGVVAKKSAPSLPLPMSWPAARSNSPLRPGAHKVKCGVKLPSLRTN